VNAPSHLDRTISRWAPLGLALLGALLLLPRIGSYGFWDPSEVHVADAARALIEGPHRLNQPPPALTVRLVAEGFRLLGVGEVGGRLPLALVSLLAILCTYYLGRAVYRPRAALIGAIAMSTMPAFLFGGRQLTSGAPAVLGLALALGGLARLAWPPGESTLIGRLTAAAAATLGLFIGHQACGLLVGILAPLAAIAVALWASPAPRGRAALFTAVSLALLGWGALAYRKLSAYSTLLGGVPRPPQMQTVVTSLLRQLGFAAAPWLAITPFAVLRAIDGEQPTRPGDDEGRAAYARVLVPAALVTTYFLATLHAATLGDLLVPGAPLLGLVAGAWLDDALDRPQARAIEGIAIAAIAVILGHDIMLTTDAFVSVQSAEQIRWPQPIYWTGNVLFGLLAAFGGLVALALMLPALWGEGETGTRDRLQRGLLVAGIGVQLVFAIALTQWFVPAASKHLSPKDLYGKTKQLDPKAPLGQYRFNASGASYFMGGRTATQLNSLEDVLAFLKRPEHVFIFVGNEELASIDQASRRGAHPVAPADGSTIPTATLVVPYYVVDDSNSRFLILSNQLPEGDKDLNPLRRFVSETAPSPQTAMSINFDDKLQLVGFDLPAEAHRGEDVKVRLYFKVLAPVGGNYKVFLHFDGPGARVNGDHVPLDGKFPTQFWTPGTYVIDEYLLKPDRATQPAGVFQLFFGLFSGDHRLKVKEGASDGENRVRLGSVRVK
jgi:4-amino-4-deoxy-L-arabinose transferase-like glycosyltransferase